MAQPGLNKIKPPPQLQLFAQLMTVAKNREKKSIFDAADCRPGFSFIPRLIYMILVAFESS
jgi:hypothetical protein